MKSALVRSFRWAPPATARQDALAHLAECFRYQYLRLVRTAVPEAVTISMLPWPTVS